MLTQEDRLVIGFSVPFILGNSTIIKKIQFFPGLKSGGGLGRHCECLIETNHDWFYWDYEFTDQESLFLKIKNRMTRRFQDGSYLKFEIIDICSTRFLSQIVETPEIVLGFSGCSLRLFETAKRKGVKKLELESPTAHISHCYEMYRAAHKKHPFDNCWLKKSLRDKMLNEYNIADVIWVNSEYSRQSFLERGIPGSKLRRRFLSVSPRFRKKRDTIKSDSLFNIVYVGSLAVAKGVPLLIEAFKQIKGMEYRLHLIGGSSSSGMAKYLRKQVNSDHRIVISCGDPIPALEAADLFVFPSWSDGWGLAAMEAMEMGVPVILTSHSGCKERIIPEKNGVIIREGSTQDISNSIRWFSSRRSG